MMPMMPGGPQPMPQPQPSPNPLGVQPQAQPQGQMPQPGQGGGMSFMDVASFLSAMAMKMVDDPAATRGIAFSKFFSEIPKLFKAQNTVGAMAPKMAATTPFSPPVGRADQTAMQGMQQARAAGAMSGGMPSGAPGPRGPAPGGAGPAQSLGALAGRGGY